MIVNHHDDERAWAAECEAARYDPDSNPESREFHAWVLERIRPLKLSDKIPASLHSFLVKWPRELAEQWIENLRDLPCNEQHWKGKYRECVEDVVRGLGHDPIRFMAKWMIDRCGGISSSYPASDYPYPESPLDDARSVQPWLEECLEKVGNPLRGLALARLSFPPFRHNATVPWLVDFLRDDQPEVCVSAALTLTNLAPETSGLRDIILAWLVRDEWRWEAFAEKNAYPRYYRKYYDPDGVGQCFAALVRLPRIVAFPDSRQIYPHARRQENPVFDHAVSYVQQHGGIRNSDPMDILAQGLDQQDVIVQRVAALALYCSGPFPPSESVLDKMREHPDPFVSRKNFQREEIKNGGPS